MYTCGQCVGIVLQQGHWQMLERFAHLIPGFRSYNTANHSYALSTALMA